MEQSRVLPPIGTRESETCEFKARLEDDDFEIAKDIAAFANALGGAIFIGIVGGDRFVRPQPMSGDEIAAAQRAIETAIRDRCRPAPDFRFVEVDSAPGKVLIVDVSPFPGQLVGVRLKKGEAQCGVSKKQPEDLFFYPRRSGTHIKGLLPEQIPMLVDAKLRRIVIHLERAVGAKAVLFSTKYLRTSGKWLQPVYVRNVDLLSNALVVDMPKDGDVRVVSIPLDAVETVTRAGETWHIYIAGKLSSVSESTSSEVAALGTYFDPMG